MRNSQAISTYDVEAERDLFYACIGAVYALHAAGQNDAAQVVGPCESARDHPTILCHSKYLLYWRVDFFWH